MQSYKRNFERPNFPKITFKINTWIFSKETAAAVTDNVVVCYLFNSVPSLLLILMRKLKT